MVILVNSWRHFGKCKSFYLKTPQITRFYLLLLKISSTRLKCWCFTILKCFNLKFYLALCLNFIDENWYEFDDENVYRIDNIENKLEKIYKNAYLIFYKKRTEVNDRKWWLSFSQSSILTSWSLKWNQIFIFNYATFHNH